MFIVDTAANGHLLLRVYDSEDRSPPERHSVTVHSVALEDDTKLCVMPIDCSTVS